MGDNKEKWKSDEEKLKDELKKDYPLIPMNNITDEARMLSVAWMECGDKNWIGQKHKLASDIMNYARRKSPQWQTTKPEFKEECLLITASKWKHGWEYTSWQIKWTECDNARYMGWFTGENEEYGDLADLNAEMYLVLPLLK